MVARMKRGFCILISVILSAVAVYAQKMTPSLDQWVIVYLSICLIAWNRGMLEGVVSTVVSFGLAGLFLIPPDKFGAEDVVMLTFLTGLGFWISSTMEKYKRGRIQGRANVELEKAKGFLDTLIDNIPLLVFVKDAEDLRFRNFNEYGCRLLNVKREELIGKNDFDICSPEEAGKFQEHDRKVLETGNVVDIPVEELTVPGRGKILLHTRKIPILDENGKPLYLLGVSEDITEKIAREKRHALEIQEEAAKKERQKLRERESIVAQTISSLSGVLSYEEATTGLVRAVVPVLGDWAVISLLSDEGELLRRTGIHRDPGLQTELDEFIRHFPPSDEDADVQAAIREGKATLRKHISEAEMEQLPRAKRKLELYLRLGTSSWVIVPLRTRDGILGVLGIARGKDREGFDELDFTLAQEICNRVSTILDNSKLFESTQKAVRARDEFLSIASHELKTPITSLRMQLEMLLRPGRSPELARPLTNAVRQVDRLTLLVNDLLDVGRLESGKMNYHLDVVGIGDVVKEVSTSMLPQFLSKGTVLLTEIDGNPFAFVDRYRMEQVIVNLLNNALKYGPGKPVHLTLTRQGSMVEMKVRDRGVGISPEHITKIFEKFERGGKVSSVAGLGLGLYITREIVQAFKGRIQVESVEGEWTEFTVLLPGA